MEDISQEIFKLSKINSASLINMRIHNIWMEVNKAAISGNYLRWNSNLDRIWCELGGDIKELKKEDEKEQQEPKEIIKYKELDRKVSEKLNNLKEKKGFSQYSKDEKLNMSKIYNVLINKEFFLRRLMNKMGKGTAYQESWDEYIHG